ncbi:MAG: hypothetical protein K2F65_04635, partial [Eubacterium sp.]|nr:hypothetical protein [Eubacterium sp.]
VYAIQFEEGSWLDVGERIEVYYEATIRYEDLPLAYSTRGESNEAFVDYYPKMGEYYQTANGSANSYPYIGNMPGKNLTNDPANRTDYTGSLFQFNNANNMMDMNYLYHDVGVSGKRNINIDRYEYLKESIVFMPGASDNNSYYGGVNGFLKDYDVNIANNQQKAYYNPKHIADKHDELPSSLTYANALGENTTSRDWYTLVMALREKSADWQIVEDHEAAVIWAQSRLHLQTAWLATSTQLIGEDNYLASTEYLPTVYNGLSLDPHYDTYPNSYSSGGRVSYYPYGSSYSTTGYVTRYRTSLNEYTKLFNDDNITALEYDQYFTSRISAYNYGDWDLTSGIEFYYVMPQGIEPKLDENGNVDFSDLKAYILSGDSKTTTSYKPQYTPIDSDLVKYQVVQKPNSEKINYKTPNIMQDPVLSSSKLNKTGDSYEGKDSYYSTDDHTSWVLRITVDKTLSKWFNRGTDTGYMMYVDVPSHVYAASDDEYWYDEVMARPLDCADGELKDGSDSLYYQVYDTTTLWGNNDLLNMPEASRVSTQYAGMDYIWNSYFYDYYSSNYNFHTGTNGNMFYLNGSPNMPYINGMNVSNREVSAQGVLSNTGKDNFSSGKRSTFASTGTRAHMRKPLIRTWTTVGKDNIAGHDVSSYYVDPQGDNSTMNIHVENKYWLNTLAPDFQYTYSSGGSYPSYTEYYSYNKSKHNYAIDGGNMGTLYYPVVTDILPAGIVPKDVNGDLFTKNNEENAKKELSWTLYGADYNNNVLGAFATLDTEKDIYSAKVEYIELEGEDGTPDGRYMVTFYQEDTDVRVPNAEKAKISSESSRVFSFDFFTVSGPDDLTEDFSTNADLLDQFQSNSTFVSSNLDNFKFLIDSETRNARTENPYYVGNTRVRYYNGWTYNTVSDPRRDVAYNTYSNASNSLPNVPVSASNTLKYKNNYAINATADRGNLRFYEDNGKLMLKNNFDDNSKELNFEDYYDIRQDVRIDANDIGKLDAGNETISTGVYTSNRIRTNHPSFENQTFVSLDPASDITNLGKRSPEGLDGIYEYYPDEATHVQYRDNLYYNVRIDNPVEKTDYYNRGNVAHGILKVTVVLPTILSYTGSYYTDGSRLDDSLYIIYKDGNGNVTKMMSLSELYDNGYTVNIVSDTRNSDGNEVLVFEIITSGDFTDPDVEPTYSDYVHGKHLPGYFGADDTLVFGIKTIVTNNVLPPNSVLDGKDYWDEAYKADSYVTFDDLSGSYLESFSDEDFAENLSYLDNLRITYTRPTQDNVYDDTDWDADTDFNDEYAQDVSAVVTLLKPHAVVRLDTSVQRVEVINPDLYGNIKRAIDDPTIKGSSRTAVYLDQAVNNGSAVGTFVVDYRVPMRGTIEGTREEAPMTADWIPNHLYAVGTGVWEIPESAGDEEYREALKNNLRVKVFALFTEDPKETDDGYESSDVSYEGIDNIWDGSWINLTELHNKSIGVDSDSVPIYENTIMDTDALFDKIPGTVYQLRYVIEAEDPDYVVPQGFRLAIDADDDPSNGSQEMDEIDPDRENINPLPESVKSNVEFNTDGTINYDETKVGNAAFIITTMTNKHPRKRHVNYFATAMSRYDDVHRAVTSERARAGYYITRELPVIQTDLSAQYFKLVSEVDPDTGKKVTNFRWDDDILISASSNMLKYTSTLHNLSDEEIILTNVKNSQEDTATNTQISVVLPFIQNIDPTIKLNEDGSDAYYPNDDAHEGAAGSIDYKNYAYVPYGSDEWSNSIDKNYKSSTAFLPNFTPVWTWHVENEEGEVVESEIDSVTLVMNDKITDITNTRERRVLTFSSEGVLHPGQRVVIDLMCPISMDYSGIVSDDLMNCKTYGFKPGAFIPYIPEVEASSKTYAYEIDSRDVNDNTLHNSENTLTTSISVISFSSKQVFNRTKVSYSEYGYGANVSGNTTKRPSLVPEGTDYSFLSSIINPDTLPQTEDNKGFNQPVIYDVLPFVGDTSLMEQEGGFVPSRGSDWRGYLQLESLEVISQTGNVKSVLQNDTQVDIWIGPFNYDSKAVGGIKEIDISKLPTVQQTSDKDFYISLRGKSTKAMNEKKKYFVTLTDLLKLKNTNRDRFEELQRHAQAIYVETKENYYLASNTMLSVSYSLKAPLNLPLFDGYTPEDNDSLKVDVSDVDGWNTFTAQTEGQQVTESPEAGVYLAAPADKGYIGHYVWLDESYNAEFFDEADYYQKDGAGRWILEKATKDLNYDGKIDDPGINGVKVELLSAKGYPVNKLGQPVVVVGDRYCLIDENTGLLKRDTTNNLMYTTLGPVSYTTEKDAYGNDGYFIISNITPGSYKLRYTFPETGEYDKYAITTRTIGQSKVPMTVYRPGSTLPNLGNAGKGDEPSDGAKVNTLVIQTDTAIRIDAIGTDPSKYDAYDAKMTSYDLGVAPSFAYGGVAWRERNNQIDGEKQTNENGISNMLIAIYEVIENPNAVDEKDRYDY